MGSTKCNAICLASAIAVAGATASAAHAKNVFQAKGLNVSAFNGEPHRTAITVSVLAGSHIAVPFGTPVAVHLKSEILSSRVQAGDAIPLQVDEDVVVSGYVVMAKGAEGAAVVESVVPASADSPGQVSLTFKWVRAIDGSKIGVVGQHAAIGRSGSNAVGAVDAVSTLSDTSNAAGAYQAANIFERAHNVLKSLNVHTKQSEAAVGTERTISLEVRNRNGVTIFSSQKATSNVDSDVDVK